MQGPKPVTREFARMLDSVAMEGFGIPGLILMENAGAGCAASVMRMLEMKQPPHAVVVVTGKGNNGGDGFVVARHLHNKGVFVLVLGVQLKHEPSSVEIAVSPAAGQKAARTEKIAQRYGIELPPPPASDFVVNLRIMKKMGIKSLEIGTEISAEALGSFLKDTDMVVDALLGTGAYGAPREPYDKIIAQMNSAGVPIVSVDCPSGLDVNTGEAPGECVKATRTVTFAAPKIGFSTGRGPEMCGDVEVVDISIPRVLLEGGKEA